MSDIPFEVEVVEKTPEEKKPGEASPGSRDPKGGNAGGEKALSVSQLTRRIRGLLEEALPTVLVEGEISNFMRAASGHLYFNLKDDKAQIRCVMFRAAAGSLKFEPEDGLEVVLRGRVSVYEARGEYQIQALTLEPKGIGALQLAFEQLKKKLADEGLFDEKHKQPLPFLPRGIGVVTSAQGAAIRDILHVLERRFPTVPVLIHPATVQGDRAAAEIAGAIETLNRVAGENRLDVIIIGRGGGSVEDLWAFNEEPVARAIFASRVPIVSAVGHEVDFTIADFVADVRAPTPSAAAEIIVPNREDLRYTVGTLREQLINRVTEDVTLGQERWQHLRARLGSPEERLHQTVQRVDEMQLRGQQAIARRMTSAAERIDQARGSLAAARPDRFNRLHRQAVRGMERRLAPALRRHVGLQRERLAGQGELLDSLSPLTVMGRGYGVVRDKSGRVVRSVTQVSPGDDLHVRLRDGTIKSTVTKTEKQSGPKN